MNLSGFSRNSKRSLAFVGTYLPHKCGIATFTSDLLHSIRLESPESDCWAIALTNVTEGYLYPDEVRFEINSKNLPNYRLAADYLNINQVDTVCIQHEFGIFGGNEGSHVIELLRNLRIPVVTTLHTVLTEPNEKQRLVIKDIGLYSDRLVVMNEKSVAVLKEVYEIPENKIRLIYHGIPDLPFVDPNYYKDQFGFEGKKVILTFGLLSPGKGIEYMIDALPQIVEKHPDTAYVVLGATHPVVKVESGESYRHSLQLRARKNNVEDHLIFHNRFVTLSELCEFLGADDVFVTPYLSKEQMVSGTLSYALGAGKAVVSTPYWYAEEILSDGRGKLVPFRDSKALAETIIELFDNEVAMHSMRKKAYLFSRKMVWEKVARRYLEVFSEVKKELELHPKPIFRLNTLKITNMKLPQIKLDHLKRLTDDVGMLQHASFIIPNRFHGYCTDDNARAIIVALSALNFLPTDKALIGLTCRYMGFIYHAFNHEKGRFRNFMSYDRRWLEEQGSEDAHGRAIWGLGMAVSLSKISGITNTAIHILKRALHAVNTFSSPRSWAFSIIGISEYLKSFSGDMEARRTFEILSSRLFDLYRKNATEEWPWIEDKVTYANGKISQALIISGRILQNKEMKEAGLRSLEWLDNIQTDPKGYFVPVGNRGWYRKGGEKARFDQQPIEAQNMIEAFLEAYNTTGNREWIKKAKQTFYWFLGENDLGLSLYDYKSGGCCDGINSDNVNTNQGAESTLSWLLSLLNFHALNQSETMKNREVSHSVIFDRN
ncbi:MAG: glycosyl transferase family 1 [Spirochaetes bacterium]|nr:MAG: glycosyl transferase family 1 [Spirochaetota bacterium]